MKRYVELKDISDGKKYSHNDMVRLGCNDCEGCSACCANMESTVLDPWDISRLSFSSGYNWEHMFDEYLKLTVTDGLILPHLNMDNADNRCIFLDENGRCSVHEYRPGVCRLFPLGRVYEEDGFYYFLQTKECKKERRSKIKIEKWLGIPQLVLYEAYICKWHKLLGILQESLSSLDETQTKTLHMFMLKTFFTTPYEKEDFYGQFDRRYGKFIQTLGIQVTV